MKMTSSSNGLVLQGYFRTERYRGPVNRDTVAQRMAPARPTPPPPRFDLLLAKMRGAAAQPKAGPGSGGAWSGAPRPDLLPGMGPTRVNGLWRMAQARSSHPISTTQIPAGQLRVIGNGRALDDAIRQTMESFFQADFSGVRVHEGPAAQAMGALAFTLGEEIHFAPGLYDPASREGVALLGHELTHVVQQRDGRVANPYGHGVAIVQDPALEAEADQMGQKIADELWSGLRAPRAAVSPVNRTPAIQAKPGELRTLRGLPSLKLVAPSFMRGVASGGWPASLPRGGMTASAIQAAPTRQEVLSTGVDLADSKDPDFILGGRIRYKLIADHLNRSYMLSGAQQVTAADVQTEHLTPRSLAHAVRLAAPRIHKRRTSKATVICEMWDAETGAWYAGRSGHGLGQGQVPQVIWNRVPIVTKEDKSDWSFGRNCAEVECIIKAYGAGKVANDLRNCYFVSYHTRLGKYIGPCRTCNRWITDSSGQIYRPQA